MTLTNVPDRIQYYFLEGWHIDKPDIKVLLKSQELPNMFLFSCYDLGLYSNQAFLQEFEEFFWILMES